MSRPFRWTGRNLNEAEQACGDDIIAQHGDRLLLPDPNDDTAYRTALPGDTVTRTGPDQYRIKRG